MTTFIIGRDPNNDIVLNDGLVSRRHAQLSVNSGIASVTDLGSSNGTFVNGNRVSECVLKAGDVLKCGAAFINWSAYLAGGPSQRSGMVSEQNYSAAAAHGEADGSVRIFEVFRELSGGIFQIGDFFRSMRDKAPAIWFLKCIPPAAVLLVSIIAYLKYRFGEFYFSPTLLAAFVFGVSPFLTILVLSAVKKTTMDKVALASGIMGFLQFTAFATYMIYIWMVVSSGSRNEGDSFFGLGGLLNHVNTFTVCISFLLLLITINLFVALCIFLYKYFIAIGFTRSRAIYRIASTIMLNSFVQYLCYYMFFLILRNDHGFH